MNMNLPMDTNKNRYEKPVQTPGWGAEVANLNSITFAQKGMTTAADVGWNLSDMTEPSRCQETAVAAEGAGTGATTNNLDRSIDCNKRNTTGRKLATKGDEYMEPIPVGHDVMLAGRGEMVDGPDLVGPHSSTEQSVVLRLDVDQVEHVPANIVHPGVKMFRNQPVTDGPAGPDRTRRPVGTDGMHAVHDADRPTAGGPVGRLFNLGPLDPSRMPSLDESNQPLAMGPLGTEGIHAVNDSDRPTAGGPVGRLFSLDPMGPSGMSSSGDRNQFITGQTVYNWPAGRPG